MEGKNKNSPKTLNSSMPSGFLQQLLDLTPLQLGIEYSWLLIRGLLNLVISWFWPPDILLEPELATSGCVAISNPNPIFVLAGDWSQSQVLKTAALIIIREYMSSFSGNIPWFVLFHYTKEHYSFINYSINRTTWQLATNVLD